MTGAIYNLQLPLVFDFCLFIHSKMLWWLSTFMASSIEVKHWLKWIKDVLITRLLSLLILNYEMLESCPKSLHGNERIFGIMQNLTYDLNVTILDAHDFIIHVFLWPRSVLAFLIEFNGWSVENVNQSCLVFWKNFGVLHLFFFKYSYKTNNTFCFIFHLITSYISNPEEANTQVNYFKFESFKDAKAKLTLQLNHWCKVMLMQKTCSVQQLTLCKIDVLLWQHRNAS